MEAFGRHIIAELSGCRLDYLENIDFIRKMIVEAALAAGAEVREVAVHKFSPQGVTGVVVIAESHLSVHTWPEVGYAAVDIYTCGDRTTPERACEYIADQLEARDVFISEIKRGISGPGKVFRHTIATGSDTRKALVPEKS